MVGIYRSNKEYISYRSNVITLGQHNYEDVFDSCTCAGMTTSTSDCSIPKQQGTWPTLCQEWCLSMYTVYSTWVNIQSCIHDHDAHTYTILPIWSTEAFDMMPIYAETGKAITRHDGRVYYVCCHWTKTRISLCYAYWNMSFGRECVENLPYPTHFLYTWNPYFCLVNCNYKTLDLMLNPHIKGNSACSYLMLVGPSHMHDNPYYLYRENTGLICMVCTKKFNVYR